MFEFLKKFKKKREVDNTEKGKNEKIVSTGFSISDSIEASKNELNLKFEKPQDYSGNRNLYDSASTKVNTKKIIFSSGEIVKDPYTGKILELTKAEAKMKYGENWAEHLAETDHIVPLEKIHSRIKDNPWVTNNNAKEIGNSNENVEVISRTLNNAKRSRTNEELVNDPEYLKKTGIELSEDAKRKAIASGKDAQKKIDQKIKNASRKNMIQSGHNAGIKTAKNAGLMTATLSTTYNLVSVIRGEKDPTEAIKDISIDTGKAAALGYISGGGMTVVSHSLSSSSSQFLKALGESNVPAKVITAVTLIGNTLKKYGEGEISTRECMLEIGEKGLCFATTGYSMAVGQAIIPIPIVGAAIGALVGSTITSKYYNEIINELKFKELEHLERERLIKEARLAEDTAKRYKEELQSYLNSYFKEYKTCFDEALFEIKSAFEIGDADGVISGANKITTKLGGEVHYNSVKEFKSFLSSDNVDIF